MMRLALTMGKTLKALGDEMPAGELAYWIAFEQLEGPIGSLRGDMQAGTVAASICNVHRGKHDKPLSPSDFLPDFDGSRKKERKRKSIAAWQALGMRLKEEGHCGNRHRTTDSEADG